MKAKKLLREFILRFDVFATPACLRYKGEPAYESVQCGLFSIIRIIRNYVRRSSRGVVI